MYSYIFEAILSLASLGMGALILLSPHQEVRLGWLPWTDRSLGVWLVGLGVLGIVLVVLAATGQARFPLTLFSLAALILIARGLFFSAWRFEGAGEAKRALWLILGLFLAFIGAIPMKSRTASAYRASGHR